MRRGPTRLPATMRAWVSLLERGDGVCGGDLVEDAVNVLSQERRGPVLRIAAQLEVGERVLAQMSVGDDHAVVGADRPDLEGPRLVLELSSVCTPSWNELERRDVGPEQVGV